MAWRREVARQASRAYAVNEKLAVFAVAGSVAGSWQISAPTWSWTAIGWPLHVIKTGVDGADPDLVKHMRLAAVQPCLPFVGAEIIERWRGRSRHYPDDLARRMVTRALTPHVLSGWSEREALVAHGDLVAVYGLLARIEGAPAGCPARGQPDYQAHRLFKGQRAGLEALALAPVDFGRRLDALWEIPGHGDFNDARALLVETWTSFKTGSDLTSVSSAAHSRSAENDRSHVTHKRGRGSVARRRLPRRGHA